MMTPEALYAIGTTLAWFGWIFVIRALWLLLRLAARPPGLNREGTLQGLVLASGGAAVLLIASLGMPMDLGREAPGPGWQLPLVWFYMNFWGWFTVAAGGMVGARLLQSTSAIAAFERRERLLQAAAWFAAAIVGGFIFWRTGADVTIFRGALPVRPATAVAVAALAIATMGAMAYAARATSSRGYSKAIVTHAALVAGSIVFGIPFLWLVITSFKEDRDISSADGLVWIPKVTEQVPFKNPENPWYQGEFEGLTVRGTILRELEDGQVQVDIDEPVSVRGRTFITPKTNLNEVPRLVDVLEAEFQGQTVQGFVREELPDGRRVLEIMRPESLKGERHAFEAADTEPVRHEGLRWRNYTQALEYLPPETGYGLVYLKNTLILVFLGTAGTLLSCSIVAYAFSRMRFPFKNSLFMLVLSTMMLPGAVTMLPGFLIFRYLGWIDTLYPLWVPAFFGSAFNVFLLRQFFMGIPMELEDAAKIDGCSFLRTFWQVMMPQIKPALAVIAIWSIMGTWNNFMGPLIFINSPENMPIAYAVQLFHSQRGGEQGLMMAFATMSMIPILLLFFFAQKYFIEGVSLTGLGGR